MTRQRPMWRKLVRTSLLLCLAGLAVVANIMLPATRTAPLWAPLLLLAAFYFAVDVYAIDKRKPDVNVPVDAPPPRCGVLGHHEVDGAPGYGVFLMLRGLPVLIDLREDEWLAQREVQAMFLHTQQAALERGLDAFIAAHPEFAGRTIVAIGLHAATITQGEVFWEPTGHTRLNGLDFSR